MNARTMQLLKRVVETAAAAEEAEWAAQISKSDHEESLRELMAWADDDGFEYFGCVNLVPVGGQVYAVQLESADGSDQLDISICDALDDGTHRALISLLEGDSSEELADYVEGDL